MAETIDITPEGAKTPEGVARINAAMTQKADADARARGLLSELIDSFGDEILDLLRQRDEGDLYDEIELALHRVKQADNELVRAIAGQPTDREPERAEPIAPTSLMDGLEALGFHPWHTGGGCYAMSQNCEDGRHYILVTDDDAQFPREGEAVLVGVYDEDGDVPIESSEDVTTRDEVLALVTRWLSRYGSKA